MKNITYRPGRPLLEVVDLRFPEGDCLPGREDKLRQKETAGFSLLIRRQSVSFGIFCGGNRATVRPMLFTGLVIVIA
jgi:hypothetical protein